jgi:hypothetical protein
MPGLKVSRIVHARHPVLGDSVDARGVSVEPPTV